MVAAIACHWHLPQIGAPLALPTFVANLLLLDVSLNVTLWAIQLEVVMAPMIVLLYFLERRYGQRLLVLIAFATTFLAFAPRWAPPAPSIVSTFCVYFFDLVLGMLIPTLGRNWVLQLPKTTTDLWLAIALPGLFLPWPLFGFYSAFSVIVEGYAAATLVSLIAFRSEIAGVRCLDWRAVRMLGLSSGSFYVLHIPVLSWIAPVVASAIPTPLGIQLPIIAPRL